MTRTGEQEIQSVSGRLLDNLGEWHTCMCSFLVHIHHADKLFYLYKSVEG